MSKSATTIAVENALICTLPFLKKEVPIVVDGKRRYCDLAGEYEGFTYGIEVKVYSGDFETGCGLNQENFDFGYVAVPTELLATAIGKLYLKGFHKTGVLEYRRTDGKIVHRKEAEYNGFEEGDEYE